LLRGNQDSQHRADRWPFPRELQRWRGACISYPAARGDPF
jgi:hypothetical protein